MPNRSLPSPAITLFAALAAALVTPLRAQQRAESGAFVVRLGTDTIAVERYARTGNRIEGDEVVRTPSTTLRHYVATLAPDGSITMLEYDARRLNGSLPPTHAVMRFGADTVVIEARFGGRDTTMRVPARGALPYVNYSYGLLEPAFMRARSATGDSTVIAFVALGAPESTPGTVRRVGRDSMSLAIFEPTPYRAKLDARGRILGLHGLATTQKVIVDRVPQADVEGTATAWAKRDSTGQSLGTLSPLDSVHSAVGTAQLHIVYSRPARRGRTILGGVVPFDQVWRTGANEATVFRTSADLVIGGAAVPAGTYTLWTLPSARGAKLIINRQSGQWGTDYDATQDLARVDATVTKLAEPVERFTMAIEPSANGGTLKYMWGDTQFAVPFTVKQ